MRAKYTLHIRYISTQIKFNLTKFRSLFFDIQGIAMGIISYMSKTKNEEDQKKGAKLLD